MRRRRFIQSLLGAFGLAGAGAEFSAPAAIAARRSVLLQTSSVAGFQYHEGESVWALLAYGHAVDLVRESENTYDTNAVRIDWRGHRLGYVPKMENYAVAQLMDRGKSLAARIRDLQVCANPWDRIQIEILIEVA